LEAQVGLLDLTFRRETNLKSVIVAKTHGAEGVQDGDSQSSLFTRLQIGPWLLIIGCHQKGNIAQAECANGDLFGNRDPVASLNWSKSSS
jgi:hypothetical protein